MSTGRGLGAGRAGGGIGVWPRAGATALLLALALVGSRPLAAAAVCDAGTALTPIGVDTEAGTVLLAVPPLGNSGRGWIAEIPADAGKARLYLDTPTAGGSGGRLGGSVGPGPVLAAVPCGGSCLQPVRWGKGSWEPLGEPLQVPSVNTAIGTYDLDGVPWFVIHGLGDEPGRVRAWAFRLEGREWRPRGEMQVTAAGDLAAVPAPSPKDGAPARGVLSGTGLFSAGAKPTTWIQGLPDLPPARQGQVIALGGTAAAYLSADGIIYLSSDTGKSWKRSTWTPWGGSTAGMWRQGSDYWVDLPVGDRRGPLQLAWFDRRTPGQETLYLTRLGPGGAWTTLAQAKSEVTTKNDHLPVSHVLAPREGSWVLLSGCVATAGSAGGSALVVRTFENGALSAPRLVPLAEGR